MRTKDLAEWLDISTSTVKTWTREFAEYLSATAHGGDGQYRYFEKRDAEVMAHIARLRNQNKSWDEIHAELARLKENNYSDLPEMDVQPPSVPVPMVPELAAKAAVERERHELTRRIVELQDRVIDLETLLEQERLAHSETRERLTQELMQTREDLGIAQGQLQAIETAEGRARRLMVIGLIAIAVVAIVLLAAVLLLALDGAG